jgi:hypothetical protein
MIHELWEEIRVGRRRAVDNGGIVLRPLSYLGAARPLMLLL